MSRQSQKRFFNRLRRSLRRRCLLLRKNKLISALLYLRNSRLNSSLLHRLSNYLRHSLVKGMWQDIVSCRVLEIIGNGMCCRDFHFIVDDQCTGIQCAPKHPRKCQGIVDLVWKIASSSAEDGGRAFRLFWGDFGSWVCHGKD